MAITVADLVNVPRLRLKVVAGREGLTRPVAWAHASDLEDPWEWLAGGELLMKNGRTLPAKAKPQATFVEQVAASGSSGLVIGDDPRTPRIATETTTAADRLGFAVLRIPYSVGFVSIAREVADANVADSAQRLARIERLYAIIRSSVGGRARGSVLNKIGRELGCRLFLMDADTGDPVPRAGQNQHARLRRLATAAVAQRGGAVPGILRLGGDAEPAAVAVDVPFPEPTLLVAVGLAGTSPELALLQHAATAAAVELSSETVRLEHERRVGAELLAHLIDARLDATTAQQHLDDAGLDRGDLLLAVVRGGEEDAQRGLHTSLARRGIRHLLLRRAGLLYVVFPETSTAIAVMRHRLGQQTRIGVSARVADPTRVPAACREGLWALATADDAPDHLAHYGGQAPLVGLRDPEEAQSLVERALGSLIAYDEAHSTSLVDSLSTFLSCQRSWQRAAQELRVHKHTVVYRMQRVEQITGYRLAETATIAELWLALRARELTTGSARDSH